MIPVPTGLVCNHLEHPLGVETPAPRLSWRLEGDRRGLRKYYYHGLSHPIGLVVHDVGSADGRAYVVTELLEGRTLRDYWIGAEPVELLSGDYNRDTLPDLAVAVRGGWHDWAGWLGRQLDPHALRTIRLDDTLEES